MPLLRRIAPAAARSLVFLCAVALTGCLGIARRAAVDQRDAQAEQGMARLAEVPPARIAQFFDDRMALALSLTPEQRPKVAAVNLRFAEVVHAIATGTGRVREKLTSLHSAEIKRASEVKPILKPAQVTRFEELRVQWRQAFRARLMEGNAPPLSQP